MRLVAGAMGCNADRVMRRNLTRSGALRKIDPPHHEGGKKSGPTDHACEEKPLTSNTQSNRLVLRRGKLRRLSKPSCRISDDFYGRIPHYPKETSTSEVVNARIYGGFTNITSLE